MNSDRYLDPPDEPEAQYCDDCGQEMEWEIGLSGIEEFGYFRCVNPYCPSNVDSSNFPSKEELARKIIDLEETIEDNRKYQNKVAGIVHKLENELITEHKYVEELLKEVDTLRSQIGNGE